MSWSNFAKRNNMLKNFRSHLCKPLTNPVSFNIITKLFVFVHFILLYIVSVIVSKFNFFVCRLVKTVSRAGPQNVTFTTCFGEKVTGGNNYHLFTETEGNVLKWASYNAIVSAV
jgi:hypothetical protein